MKVKTVADLLDARDNHLIRKQGHGRIKNRVAYCKINVIDRQVVPLPVDSEVIGIAVHLGELYLKVSLGTSVYLSDRYFYAFDQGQGITMPNLGYIDTIRIGDSIWSVFEDDIL